MATQALSKPCTCKNQARKPGPGRLINGRPYSRNREDYRELCHGCHMRYDHKGRIHTPEARARMSAGLKRRWDQARREGRGGTPLEDA